MFARRRIFCAAISNNISAWHQRESVVLRDGNNDSVDAVAVNKTACAALYCLPRMCRSNAHRLGLPRGRTNTSSFAYKPLDAALIAL